MRKGVVMTVTSSDVPKKATRARKDVVKTEDQSEVSNIHKMTVTDPAKILVEAAKTMESASKELTGGKILVKMLTDNQSYITDTGAKFTKSHPYQLVEESEANLLIDNGGFRKASPQELIDFYIND